MSLTNPNKKLSAADKAQLKAKVNNYIVINFGYSNLVFPHKEGMQVLEALNVAEITSDRYSEANKIEPIKRDSFNVRFISEDEYLDNKMNALLEIPDDKA